MTNSQGIRIKDMADLCEEAHTRTVNECTEKNIKIDRIENDEIAYTPEAQEIFDRHYNELVELTGI